MIHKLTDDIWWGNKPSVEETLGQANSIINVAHSIRNPYWRDLGKLSWEIWYFRLGCPDGVEPDTQYIRAFCLICDAIKYAEKFPLLCHCRAGAHRGPTAALLAYWHINGRTDEAFQFGFEAVCLEQPNYCKNRCSKAYRNTLLQFMRSHPNG